MPNTSKTTELETAAITAAAHLVATEFPTLPLAEQIALAAGIATGKLAYCQDCGHVFEAAAPCSMCSDLADAAAAAQDDAEYGRHATHYNRF